MTGGVIFKKRRRAKITDPENEWSRSREIHALQVPRCSFLSSKQNSEQHNGDITKSHSKAAYSEAIVLWMISTMSLKEQSPNITPNLMRQAVRDIRALDDLPLQIYHHESQEQNVHCYFLRRDLGQTKGQFLWHN